MLPIAPCASEIEIFQIQRRHTPIFASSRAFSPHARPSGRSSGFGDRKSSASEHQIREAKQREQLRGVLRQAAVAGLTMTEEVLHHMKRMLHFCPDAHLQVFQFFRHTARLVLQQRLAFAALHRHVPSHLRLKMSGDVLVTVIFNGISVPTNMQPCAPTHSTFISRECWFMATLSVPVKNIRMLIAKIASLRILPPGPFFVEKLPDFYSRRKRVPRLKARTSIHHGKHRRGAGISAETPSVALPTCLSRCQYLIRASQYIALIHGLGFWSWS